MRPLVLSLLHSLTGARLSLGFGKEGCPVLQRLIHLCFWSQSRPLLSSHLYSPNTSQAQADKELKGNRFYHGGEVPEASEHLGKVGWEREGSTI